MPAPIFVRSFSTIALLSVGLAACVDRRDAPAAAPVRKADPVCKEGSSEQHSGGTLKSCLLAQDWLSGAHTCRANWSLVLHPNGALKECKISGTATFDGLVIKESLALYEDGRLRRGMVGAAKAFGEVTAREGDWITLSPAGALSRLELFGGPRSIQGIPCKGSETYFHASGRLRKCMLSEKHRVGGEDLPPDTFLCLDEQGQRTMPCGVMTP